VFDQLFSFVLTEQLLLNMKLISRTLQYLLTRSLRLRESNVEVESDASECLANIVTLMEKYASQDPEFWQSLSVVAGKHLVSVDPDVLQRLIVACPNTEHHRMVRILANYLMSIGESTATVVFDGWCLSPTASRVFECLLDAMSTANHAPFSQILLDYIFQSDEGRLPPSVRAARNTVIYCVLESAYHRFLSQSQDTATALAVPMSVDA
jgi:hypothetical protein